VEPGVAVPCGSLPTWGILLLYLSTKGKGEGKIPSASSECTEAREGLSDPIFHCLERGGNLKRSAQGTLSSSQASGSFSQSTACCWKFSASRKEEDSQPNRT